MASMVDKKFLFYGLVLLFIAGFRVVTGVTCPQLQGDTEHARSVNKRVQKLAEDRAFIIYDADKKYEYTINLCQNDESVAAVVQQDLKAKHPYNIGYYNDAKVVGGADWILLTYYGDAYNTHCGNSKKRSMFHIICDQSADTHKKRTPKIITEYAPKNNLNETFCYYLFEMRHSGVCPAVPKTKISPGSVFIVIVVIVGVLYFVLGLLYQRFIVGAKGLEQIPNYLMWREFGTLQADGCNYMCRCKASREPTRYKPMDDAIADDDEEEGGEKDDALLPM